MLIVTRQNRSPACALLLGGFDGLHRGHGGLLAAARATGLPVALTTILGGKAGGELFTRTERRFLFEQEGVAFLSEYDFTPELRATSPDVFLRDLFARFEARALFCGEDFRFGRDAAGTPELLRSAAPCPVGVIPLAREGEGKISTSAIKALVASGRIAEADALLGHPYFMQGRVEHGRHVGGPVLGFPTVNLSLPPEKVLPPEGVYAGYAETPAGTYPAVINLGPRPTFGVAERKTEAYLDGFSGDLYGADVRIFPGRFLRPVRRFESAEALREQLGRDIACLRGGNEKRSTV